MNADRLGTYEKSFPYGELATAPATSGEKFATYWRDAGTGLDYAVNRYYSPQMGRFLSADPYQASGGPAEPGSWNRYAYVEGDPVNYGDPAGLQRSIITIWGQFCSWKGYPDDGGRWADCTPWATSFISGTGSGVVGGEAEPGGPSGGVSIAGAYAALSKEKCWTLMRATSAEAAKSLLTNAPLILEDLKGVSFNEVPPSPGLDPGTAPKDFVSEWQDGYSENGKIYVNSQLYNSSSVAKWGPGEQKASILDMMSSIYGSLTAGQYQAMVILHELSHVLGRANDQTSQSITREFNRSIIRDCL